MNTDSSTCASPDEEDETVEDVLQLPDNDEPPEFEEGDEDDDE